MKGGKVPIHIQRWAPADYHGDEHVKLLKARRDYRTLTFYRHFLDASFLAGGDLPADPEALAAVVEMPRRDVEHALSFCLGRLIRQEGDRLYQKRVKRDVTAELEFRGLQSERGKLGGRPKKETDGFSVVKPPVVESESPPTPTPTPTPTPQRTSARPRGDTPVVWSREACDAWIARFGGTAPGGQIGKALKPLVDRHGWAEVAKAWRSYLGQADAEYASPPRFAATYGRWSGTAPPGTGRESSADVLRAAVMGGMKGK